MAEQGSIRQQRDELRRTRPRAPVSTTPKTPVGKPPEAPVLPSLRRPPTPPRVQPAGSSARDAASSVFAKLRRGGVNLPTANAVAFSAQQQSENAYQEGLGSVDAFEAGVGPQGDTTEPVLRTIPKSYVGEDQEEEEFAEQQASMKRTQEQFLPGSTGLPQASFEGAQVERQQSTRPTTASEEGGASDEELAAAAAYAGQVALARQLAEAEGAEAQEGEDEGNPSVARAAESAKRAYVFGADAIGAIEAVVFSESVIGALPGLIEVLVSSNTRLLVWGLKLKPNSLIRQIEPPALYPFEVTAIITADILLIMIFFIFVCLLLAMAFVVYSLATAIPGLPDIPGLSTLVSNAASTVSNTAH